MPHDPLVDPSWPAELRATQRDGECIVTELSLLEMLHLLRSARTEQLMVAPLEGGDGGLA